MQDSNLNLILAQINKDYGPNTINRLKDSKILSLSYISSGLHFLDYCISGLGNGFPRGKIVELYGLPSGGKSLISAITVASAQRAKLDCVWIDAENAFDPAFAKKIGVDVDRLIVSQSSVGEPTMDIVCKLLQANPGIIVVDSVASMVPMDDMEKSFTESTMATRARLMSRGVAKINAMNQNTLVIFINQLRNNIGMYGGPSVTTGGRALGHYASVRIEVKQGDFIEKSKERIGQTVKFRVTKNKVGPPWKEGYFKFYYDGHIDKEDELVSLAILTNKIKPSGSWFEIAGKKLQGREVLEETLRTDNEFLTKFMKEIV